MDVIKPETKSVEFKLVFILYYQSLLEEPLDRFGEDAVERWFTEEGVDELIGFTEGLAA